MWGVPGSIITIGSTTYSYESVELFGRASYLTDNYSAVTFTFHLWCATTSGAGIVCGNETWNAASHPYSFSDGPPSPDPQWPTWISPDGHAGVEYLEGGHARLLVAT
jgi:hypothetical protein